MKQNKYEVPTQFGWHTPTSYDEQNLPIDYKTEMVDNIDNLTLEQCRFIADVVGKETKFVTEVMDDETFYKMYTTHASLSI